MNTLTTKFKQLVPIIISIFAAAVFIDSLRYKFTDHPNTQVIFGKLNDWSGTIGVPGLFTYTGLLSQYVIGSVELVASLLLIVGLFPRFKVAQAFGALTALGVMSGAVFFHLFTPLGIDPNNDGGGLFVAAVILWLGALYLTIIRRSIIKETLLKLFK
jgi:uncharacterized membrane protein YphA (DoxX/SURF4 family)